MNNKARFLGIAFALLFLANSSPAQLEHRVWEPFEGIPVRQGYHIEWFRTTATNDQGDLAMIWSDTRTGGRDMYMQVVDVDGNELWTDYEDGKLVATGYSRQEDPHVMATSDGGWIVTWVDYRWSATNEEDAEIYIDKLDQDGNSVWSNHEFYAEGIPLTNQVPSKQKIVQSFDDGNGGAVSIWVDGRAQNADLYGQHIDANGDIQWFPDGQPENRNGRVIAGGPSSQGSVESGNYTADTDGAGGMVFGWIDNINPNNQNLYCNRVDADGDLLWGEIGGISICLVEGEQDKLRLAPDGNGGAIFVWEDRRNPDDFDIYGQYVNSDGDVEWSVGGDVVCDAINIQESPRIVQSGDNEAILVWQDKRVDNFSYDLYTQRISDNNGNLQLHWNGTSGLLLTDANSDQKQARLFMDGTGGAIYTWIDERNGQTPNNDMYAQRIDANGVLQWGVDGFALCDAVNQQGGNIVRMMDDNHFSVSWVDNREGSPGIYYQIMSLAGDEFLPHNGKKLVFGIDSNSSNPEIYSAGDNYYYMSWTDGRQGVFGSYPYVQILQTELAGRGYEMLSDLNGVSMLPGFPDIGAEVDVIEIQELIQTVSSNGDLISVWKDNRVSSTSLLFAQKMDLEGNVLWGDQGTAVTYDPDFPIPVSQERPQIIPTDDGGAFVVYNELDFNFWLHVNVQRLDANGDGLWGLNNAGIVLTELSTNHFIQDIAYFDDGNILIVYQRNDENHDKDIFAMCLDQTGEIVWAETPLCEADELQTFAKIVEVNGGLVVVWEDQRRGGTIRDLYGQLVSPEGTLAWAADGAMLIEADNQQNEVQLSTSGSDAEWFWMTWKSAQDGQNEDIYTQRFDLNGVAILEPATGILVGEDGAAQQTPETVMSDQGNFVDGLFIIWEGTPPDSLFSDLFFTLLDVDGNVIESPAGGDTLTTAYHRQAEISVVADGYGGFISVWRDNRATGKDELQNIYMQRVNWPITPVRGYQQAQLPVKMSLDNNYPNPFNPSTTIKFSIDSPSSVALVIYDVLGREVTRLVNHKLLAGEHVAHWNGLSSFGQSVASGTYFYRLEVEGEVMTRSMILLK
jgi:FlgD Ig-like domain